VRLCWARVSLCNTAISDGDNPYGVCGIVMPFGSAATKLTGKQLDTLARVDHAARRGVTASSRPSCWRARINPQ
jgi:hypothetical protein